MKFLSSLFFVLAVSCNAAPQDAESNRPKIETLSFDTGFKDIMKGLTELFSTLLTGLNNRSNETESSFPLAGFPPSGFPSFVFPSNPDANTTFETKVVDGNRININTSATDTGNGFFKTRIISIFPVQNSDLPAKKPEAEIPANDENENEVYENFGKEKNLSRKKRFTFDDLLDAVLRMKYSVFLKPETNLANLARTGINIAEVEGNAIDKVSGLRQHPAKPYDLSGDTRVNYVRSQNRESPLDNPDVEVFDAGLVKEDERRNSRPRFSALQDGQKFASLTTSEQGGQKDLRRVPIAGPINPHHQAYWRYPTEGNHRGNANIRGTYRGNAHPRGNYQATGSEDVEVF